jgi:hypothetical protein
MTLLKKISWDNILLDVMVMAFFQFAYAPIESYFVAHFNTYYWYVEGIQLYIFMLMVARYVYDRADAGSVIDENFGASSIPKVGYAFVALGGLWLMFAGFQMKKPENWVFGIHFFGHFFAALWVALYGTRLGALFHKLRFRKLTVHAIVMAQVTIGFIALEACFAAVIDAAGSSNSGLAFRFGFFLWGLATFLPLRIFLMVQPPFHPLEIATAIAAYVWLFKAAIE